MKIAIPVTDGAASGPGEAREIVVFDTSTGMELERYENPALTATAARGIVMLRSVIDRKVDALVVSGIGQHAIDYARNRLRILNSGGLPISGILAAAGQGNLPEMSEATHMGHHHEH